MDPEFVVFLICGLGWVVTIPLFYQAGKQAGYAAAPRSVVEFPRWGLELGHLPGPAPLPEFVEVEPGQFGRVKWRSLRRDQWAALLESTAEARLTGAGRPFSKAELVGVRDLLIQRGCAVWRNELHPSQGWELRRSMRKAIVLHIGGVWVDRLNTTRVVE